MEQPANPTQPPAAPDASARDPDSRPRQRRSAAVSHRRLRWHLLTALMVIVGVFIWDGEQRRPAGAVTGEAFHGPVSAEPPSSLRVGTFNLWGGKGIDRARDLQRSASTLENLNLVGLQEVRGPMFWRRGNNAEQIGETLGLSWAYAPTETRWWADHFGNGMLSAFPVTHWQSIPLPGTQHRAHRNIILARIEHGGQSLTVLNVHIDSRYDRHLQLRATIELFLAIREPVILMGDLNSTAEDPCIRRLLDHPDVHSAVEETPGDGPPRAIDWIFVRGLRVLDSGSEFTGASNHPLVWAELALPP